MSKDTSYPKEETQRNMNEHVNSNTPSFDDPQYDKYWEQKTKELEHNKRLLDEYLDSLHLDRRPENYYDMKNITESFSKEYGIDQRDIRVYWIVDYFNSH